VKLCEKCGKKPIRYTGTGECNVCYKRRYRSDPVKAEKSRAASRAWKEQHREQNRTRDRAWHQDHDYGPCPICAGRMVLGSEMCAGCISDIADVRRSLAEGMWADGWSLKEMCEVLGVQTGYFGVRRERDGWDLPYRYRNTKRQLAA
jgi:hypothetical protein